MALSTYLANKLLDHAIGKADYDKPAAVYLAAFTVAPTAAGGGTEAAWASYARVAIPAASIQAAAGGASTNTADITFAASTGGGAQTVTHVATFDDAVGGNMLEFFALDAAVTINPGDSFYIATGGLDRSAT